MGCDRGAIISYHTQYINKLSLGHQVSKKKDALSHPPPQTSPAKNKKINIEQLLLLINKYHY